MSSFCNNGLTSLMGDVIRTHVLMDWRERSKACQFQPASVEKTAELTLWHLNLLHCLMISQAIELFKLSDKYDVEGLQRECIHSFHKITQTHHVAYLLQVKPLLHFSKSKRAQNALNA